MYAAPTAAGHLQKGSEYQVNKELSYLEDKTRRKGLLLNTQHFLENWSAEKFTEMCHIPQKHVDKATVQPKASETLPEVSETWPSLAISLLSHSRKTDQTCIFSQLWDKENLKAFYAATSYVSHLLLAGEQSVFLVKWRQIFSTSFLKISVFSNMRSA